MEINTKTFGNVTQQAFDTACAYIKRVSKRLSQEIETALVFAVAAVYKTGDATHVNKLIPILKLAKLEPMYRRTIVRFDLIPFSYDATKCQHVGKIKPGLRAAMEVEREGIPQWEIVLKAALEGENPENKPAKAFNGQNRMTSLVKKARENGVDDKELRAWLKSAITEHPEVDMTPDTVVADEDGNMKLVKDAA